MQTLFIGKNLIFLPQIHSTNSYATHLLKNVNLAEGTVIHTDLQTEGKGQRGALWYSEAGQNLTASVVLKPVFLELDRQFFLYQIAALACYDTITELVNTSHNDIKIKWPNDILLGSKKLSGILIENSIQNNQINWSVIGIGMNINQLSFADSLNASSLRLAKGQVLSVGETLNRLCENLEKYYLALINSKFEWINLNYQEKLFGKNDYLPYEMDEQTHYMMVEGITNEGLLILKDIHGKKKIVDVKQAKLLL